MKNILVIGGSGALGKSVVSVFKKNNPIWRVSNLDFTINSNADENIEIKNVENILNEDYIKEISKKLNKNHSNKLNCIVSVAGGWQGIGLENPSILKSLDTMIKQNLYSSVLAAHLAKMNLIEGGLLILTGANAVKDGYNPGMLSYQLAKQSVHYLTNLLVESDQLANKHIKTILPYI